MSKLYPRLNEKGILLFERVDTILTGYQVRRADDVA
jgi:hypothetical protein